ncbi:peptidyl-prolyl cis-trans isomerase FKBP62-like isoform X1 [Nymphaea colorata]|nr:peptidyl-prolyl cis-trans isomerase FKBP62-like isoform X1 [Nymphaea colorata]
MQRMQFSQAMARKNLNLVGMEEDDEDVEAGEEIDSAPPMKVGEERQINSLGLKKKLLKSGSGWETPELGDEVTVHYTVVMVDGTKCDSSRDRGEPVTFNLGAEQIYKGLDQGITTMKRLETASFSLASNTDKTFEVELISWNRVIDICKDGGVIKKIVCPGQRDQRPGDLDEVRVKYEARLADGSVIARSPEEGIEFHVKEGHFCPAISRAIKTMARGEKAILTVGPQYAFSDSGRDIVGQYCAVPPNATLDIDIEILSFKQVVDVMGDSYVLKKVLREGEGLDTPNDGAVVHVRYKGMFEDGTIFEKMGFDQEEGALFVVDEEQVIPGLDRTFATMKKGELSTVTIKPNYGFGDAEVKRDLAIVSPNSTVIYEIEMISFTKEKEPWEMDTREKIDAAAKKKEEGNILFKSGKYQQAAKKYTKAADCLNEGSFEDGEEKAAKTLKVSCWLNNAACSLKLNNFNDTIQLCSKVLDIESQNVKAMYRRAQAYIGTFDLDLAELDVRTALEVDPGNREIKSISKTLKQMQLERNKKDAKVYRNMFAPMWNGGVESKRPKVDVPRETEDSVMAMDGEHTESMAIDSS